MRRGLIALGLVTAAVCGGVATAGAAAAEDDGPWLCEVGVGDRTPGTYPGGFYVYTDCFEPGPDLGLP